MLPLAAGIYSNKRMIRINICKEDHSSAFSKNNTLPISVAPSPTININCS